MIPFLLVLLFVVGSQSANRAYLTILIRDKRSRKIALCCQVHPKTREELLPISILATPDLATNVNEIVNKVITYPDISFLKVELVRHSL